MLVDRSLILQAKEKLGEQNAIIIAETLEIEDFDTKNLKGRCCFHQEKTGSFIYNPKKYSYHCFGCQKNADIIDAFMYKGATYIEAVQKLFELAGIKHSFGELKVKTKHQYKYPKEVVCTNKDKVYEYFGKRKISKETIDYTDVRQDEHGNAVFNYYDTNDVLTMVKYRPSRKIEKGENKMWCQKDADTTPLLFNMNRINMNSPLAITEGETDCLSAIESGYTNTVSVPLGAGNYGWIEENWDWLEQFDQIIVCSDNDETGIKMQKEVVYRLGSWRTKIVEIPQFYENENGNKIPIKDLNEVLYWFGKEKVLDIILNAKDTPVDSVADFSSIKNIDLNEIDGIKTGIKDIDKSLMKLFYGTFNIVTGVNGCVDCDTEYFNGSEWKKISDYTYGENVLQYDRDGNANLVIPSIYHKYPCDYFWHFKSTYGVDQCVSDEHNLVYMSRQNNIQTKKVTEILKMHNEAKNGFSGKFITTFKYNGCGVNLTDEQIRVMCAVICDGSFLNHNSNNEKKYNKCRINIKKERKKIRLRSLLEDAHISYEEHQWNPKNIDFISFVFHSPIHTKVFDEWWYSCSQHQLEVVVDEILNWDGSICGARSGFSTTNKQSAEFIQFAFSACGKRATVKEYNRIGQRRQGYIRKSKEYYVCISNKSINPSIFNVKTKIKIPKVFSKDGFKYCFTVPSGMLVLRRNGKINITGNSGKSSFLSQIICQCLQQDKNAFLYSGELPNFQSKNWINYIFAGQRHIKQYKYDNTDFWKVTPEAQKKIDDFYQNRLFIYKDGYSNKVSDVLKTMEDTVRKYGVKLLVLDNLTALNLENNDNNKFEKQAEFVNSLIDFAKKFNVAVILVVHPHKIETMRRLSKMDVQGISAIIDLAHRILSLYRVTDADKKGKPKIKGSGWFQEPIKYDVLCDILKDRMMGFEGQCVGLYYDRPSKRFFTNAKDLDYQYDWDKEEHKEPLPFPPKQLIDDSNEVFGTIKKE